MAYTRHAVSLVHSQEDEVRGLSEACEALQIQVDEAYAKLERKDAELMRTKAELERTHIVCSEAKNELLQMKMERGDFADLERVLEASPPPFNKRPLMQRPQSLPSQGSGHFANAKPQIKHASSMPMPTRADPSP
jgi:hypothetical protein